MMSARACSALSGTSLSLLGSFFVETPPRNSDVDVSVCPLMAGPKLSMNSQASSPPLRLVSYV